MKRSIKAVMSWLPTWALILLLGMAYTCTPAPCAADMGATGRKGSIHRAAYAGDIPRLGQLLKKSPGLINQTLYENDGILGTPLDMAAKGGHVETMRFLIAHGADVHKSRPLGIASYFHKVASIRFLLGQGLNEAQITHAMIDALYGEDGSPFETMQVLLEGGASPDAKDQNRSDRRALGLTARQYDVKEVQLLLDHGADVNAEDGSGLTALDDLLLGASMIAASEDPAPQELARQQRVLELLLSHGARVNISTNARHQEPLSWAIQSRNPGLVRILLEHGAKLCPPNSDPLALFQWFFERPINGKVKPLTPMLKQMKEVLTRSLSIK